MPRSDVPESDIGLSAKQEVAISVVGKLIEICQTEESELWVSRYSDVLTALLEDRLQDAIYAECRRDSPRGERYGSAEWVVSEELASGVRKTIDRLRTHIHFYDRRPPLIVKIGEASIRDEGRTEGWTEDEELGFRDQYPN